jgi:hypothetical protein
VLFLNYSRSGTDWLLQALYSLFSISKCPGFPNSWWYWTFYMYLVHLYPFLGDISIQNLSPFSKWIITKSDFLCVLCTFLLLILCQWSSLQMFVLFCTVSCDRLFSFAVQKIFSLKVQFNQFLLLLALLLLSSSRLMCWNISPAFSRSYIGSDVIIKFESISCLHLKLYISILLQIAS